MSNDFHTQFRQQVREDRMHKTEIESNAAAAELIAERISAKLAEQNDIIYKVGQQNGRTSIIAYLSLVIGLVAAIGQLFGPFKLW